MQMNCLFLPQELNIKRAFFAFSVAFLILNSWNIWFTFTAKGSWCLSILAKNKIVYEFNNFFFHFYIFWSFHNCTRLCWTAKANRSHHVASQNIENVIFFLMNACYRLALAFASWRVTHLWQYVNIYFSIVCLKRKEGDIGGVTQYRNTLRKIGKCWNTESKIDEIPISHLWSVTLT